MHRAKSEMNASTNFGEPKRLMDETTARGEFISLVRVVALAQAEANRPTRSRSGNARPIAS